MVRLVASWPSGASSKVQVPPNAVSPTIFRTSSRGSSRSTTSVLLVPPQPFVATGSLIRPHTIAGCAGRRRVRVATCATGNDFPMPNAPRTTAASTARGYRMTPTAGETTPAPRTVPTYRYRVPSFAADAQGTVRRIRRRCRMARLRSFVRQERGLATIEYIIGAAIVLGTLVVGVQSWNNGLVSRLQALVTQLG